MSLVLPGTQGAKLLPFWAHGLQETLCPWSPTLLRSLEVAYVVLGGEEEKRSQKLGSLGEPLLRSRVHRDIGQGSQDGSVWLSRPWPHKTHPTPDPLFN